MTELRAGKKNPDLDRRKIIILNMKQDRRGFLKLFGLTSAAFVAADASASAPPVDIVTAAPAELAAMPSPHSVQSFATLNRIHRPWSPSVMDLRDEPLWGRVRIERNSMLDTYRIFQGPNCGNGGYDPSETNIDQPGSLLSPQAFCIKKIGFVFSPQTLPALRSAFIDRYALRLYLGQKRFWEAPLSMVFSVGEPTPDNPGPDGNLGFQTLPDAGFVSLAIPLILESGYYFNLELVGTPIHPCGKITAWGVFKGLHVVGIQ